MDGLNNKEFHEFIEEIKREVREEIKLTVNGKIDNLREELERHELEMKPIHDAYAAANLIATLVKWTAGLMLAIGIIYGYLNDWFK